VYVLATVADHLDEHKQVIPLRVLLSPPPQYNYGDYRQADQHESHDFTGSEQGSHHLVYTKTARQIMTTLMLAQNMQAYSVSRLMLVL